MQTAIDQFRWNIARVRNLGSLHRILSTQTTAALNLTDLLRSELVMIVSALDLYIHEVVRLGMLECFLGRRVPTDAFHRFQVTLGGTIQAISMPGSNVWLDDQVRDRLGYRTFQQPDDIAEAIRLISNVELWNSVAVQLQSTSQDVRDRLRLVVDRRNKIVHEADSSPSYGQIGILWPLNSTQTDDAVAFTESVAEAIHSVVV